MTEIFWKDYFVTLRQAVQRLAEVLHHPDLDKFVMELFWKVLKKVLAYEKIDAVTPRDVFGKAYQFNLIDDDQMWLKMLDDHNRTSHVYKQEDAKRIFKRIKTYLTTFEVTYQKIKNQYQL